MNEVVLTFGLSVGWSLVEKLLVLGAKEGGISEIVSEVLKTFLVLDGVIDTVVGRSEAETH